MVGYVTWKLGVQCSPCPLSCNLQGRGEERRLPVADPSYRFHCQLTQFGRDPGRAPLLWHNEM